MDSVITICVFLILFGIIHAKDWKPNIYLRGDDATVHIDLLETNGKNALEITFSDYTSKQRVTNVMMCDSRKNQSETISINQIYASRIKGIELNKDSLSFLLLNVNFMDSGHYKAYEDSMLKGNTSILVPRHRLLGKYSESIILPFMCNITKVTSIKIALIISKLQFFVVKYDITLENCTDVGNLFKDRIDNCSLRNSNFSFAIQNVSYLDVGIYVAWDNMDFLMDSVDVKLEENYATYSPESTHRYVRSTFTPNLLSSEAENYMFEWFLVSGLVVVLVATGIVINAVGRFRKWKTSNTTTYILKHMNGGQNTANSSSNCIQTMEMAHTPEGSQMVLTEHKPSEDWINFAYNGSQDKARLDGKHLCSRRVDSSKSAVTKVQIDPILISLCETLQSDPTNEHDYVHEYDELEPDTRFDGLYLQSKVLGTNTSEELYGQSKVLGTNTSENVVEQLYKYDDVVHHSYIILPSPAAIPVVTRKTMEHVTIADSYSGHKKGDKKSPPRVDPSALCVNVNKGSLNDVDCTGYRADIGNRYSSNKTSHPSFSDLEDYSTQDRLCQKIRNYDSLNKYDTYVPRLQSSEFQADMTSPSVSQIMSYDFAGNDLDTSSARKTGHRRSQSCGAFYGNMMANASVRRQKRGSVKTLDKEDCFDSL